MVIEIKPLHYGHSDGHADICYSTDGDKLISCGGDGDVRIWNGFDDDDPLQTCLGEFVLCVKHKKDHVLVATDSNNVQLLTYPAADRDGILTRFTGNVNHIAIGKNHNWVAVASDDMSIKLIELETKESISFPGLNGPPISVAICPKAKLLAASCGSGSLIIFDITDQSKIKEFEVVPKTNSFINAKLLCRIDFDQKHNKYFAYPDKNKVVVLNTSDWSEAYTLSTSIVENSFSIVEFSPCSNYIAGSTFEGDLVVWGLRTQSVVGCIKHPKGVAITSIAWNPKENGNLAFADNQGYVGLAINCTITDTLSKNSVEIDIFTQGNDGGGDFGDVIIEEDDEDNENAVSLEKLKNEVMGIAPSKVDEDRLSLRSISPMPRATSPGIPLQHSFIPSSTPEHLDPRYMCWNEVGVVRCYGSSLDPEDDGTRSIEVEFHDSTLHSSMMMTNFQGYTMGSISTAALAIANSSSINVVPLGLSAKEWHLNLPEDNEEIVCIATSHNLICIGTSNYLVHVCTIFGIQKCVLSVPGPIITMSAFGHVLMIAYHASSPRRGDQCVDIMLVKLEGTTVENRDIKSALGPNTVLQWLGFSDCGTPAIMDSAGMIFLHPLQSNLWLPFCDTTRTRKSPLDVFFLTAVYETIGTVRGIRCKGSLYPSFTPRPVAMEITLQSPFMELDCEKSQLEANLFTWSTLEIEECNKKYKETALKAFALAAKNNLDQRALEFMEMLQNPQILNLGLKYVNKLDKKRLAEKLVELASKLEQPEKHKAKYPTHTNVIKRQKYILTSTGKLKPKTKEKASPSHKKSPNSKGSTQEESDFSPSCSKLSTLTTQDTSILEDEPKNPFLKSLKKPKVTSYNPLSLTDKFAGYEEEKDAKENKNNSNAGAEKRKQPDSSPVEKNKEKQRKLDRFMFSKKT